MNDLDFNELDKAVNSLMDGKNAKSAEAAKSDAVPVKAAAPATPSSPKPAPVALKPIAVPTSVVPAQRGSRLPTRPVGVVKTIVDIMAPKNLTVPSKAPSRMAPDIRPLSLKRAPQPPALAAEPEKPAPVPEKIEPVVMTPVDQPTATLVDKPEFEITPPEVKPEASPAPAPTPQQPRAHEPAWPDPIDFENKRQAAAEADQAKDEPASPFIPGAKVEKRPLGAFAGDIPEAKISKDGQFQTSAPADEANLDLPGYEPTEKLVKPAKAPAPAEKINESPMMSIPAQYKTADKKADTAIRPVFDTKEYHTPLLEAANKPKHGKLWLRLIITAAILAILVVGGYFAYRALMPSGVTLP